MRTTDDKKESTIILRVNDDMRSYLEKCAQKEGIKLSAYVREVLEKSQKGIKCNTEYNEGIVNIDIAPEAYEDYSKGNYEELKIVPVGYDKALRDEIEGLKANINFLLDDSSSRREVEVMAEMTCGVDKFYKSVLDKVERGEMDFNENGFDLIDTDIVEALRNDEVRKQLDDLRQGCDEKQEDKIKAVTRVFKVGLGKVRNEIWGIRG